MGRKVGRLVFFGLAVWMRGLVIVLLISVAALVLVAIAVARHVWRQRNLPAEEAAAPAALQAQNRRLDEALRVKPEPELEHLDGTRDS